jgi:hypothetical protein
LIAAERFAMAGFHLTALGYLRHGQRAGLPLFTEGYTNAVTRLSSYLRLASEGSGTRLRSEPSFEGARPAGGAGAHGASVHRPSLAGAAQSLASWDVNEAASLHRKLASWARYIDLHRTTLTLVGADLNRQADARRPGPVLRWLGSVLLHRRRS